MNRIKSWVAKKLAAHDTSGNLRVPGGAAGIALLEPDGSQTAVLARGDSFDVYYGRDTIHSFSVIPDNALKIAWFIFRWRVGMWFGLKARLWAWAMKHPAELEAHG